MVLRRAEVCGAVVGCVQGARGLFMERLNNTQFEQQKRSDLGMELAFRGFALSLWGSLFVGLVLALLWRAIIPGTSIFERIVAFIIVVGFPVGCVAGCFFNASQLDAMSTEQLQYLAERKRTSRRLQAVGGVLLWTATIAGGLGILALRHYNQSQAKLPELPLRVTYREPMVTQGYVLQLANTAAKPIRLTVAARNNEIVELVLGGGGFTEIGELEGIKLAANDEVHISAEGYRSRTIKLP